MNMSIVPAIAYSVNAGSADNRRCEVDVYSWEIAGILLVMIAAAGAAIFNFVNGPKGPFAKRRHEQIRELEVRTRMESDEPLLADLQKLARLYVQVGKRWEAEQALRRALIIAKQQWGEHSPLVMNILQECVRLMDSMHRKGEATAFRKELNKLKGFR